MVFELGEILKGLIAAAPPLPYVETLAGIVRVETVKKQASKNSLVEKSFPLYCPLKSDCIPTNTVKLIPDHKKKSLLYFEDMGGPVRNSKTYGFSNYTTNVRLVVWLNPKQLGSDECSITSMIAHELIKRLEKKPFNDSPFTKIFIRFNREFYRDPSIFSKYKYNRQSDLLEHPYDYFALDFYVDFSVHDNCMDQFLPEAAIC